MLTVNDLFRRIICPYCGKEIKDDPENNFFCPACSEQVFVRKIGEKKMMVTRGECESYIAKKLRLVQKN